MTWTWWAVPGLLTWAAAWSAAVVLLRTAPDRSVNRRLAVLLLLEGTWLGGCVFFMVEDPGTFMAIAAVAVAGMAALPFQYVSFLSAAVDTPLVAPFRSRVALVLLGLGSAGMAAWVLVSPGTFIGELHSPAWATWNFHFTPAGQKLALAHGVGSLFGLIAALDAYRRAPPGTAARGRAKWFAIAFGTRDAYTGIILVLYPVIRPVPFLGDFLYNPGQALVYLAYVLLLAYGVLHTQLFDIDLKLKIALRRSTVGGVFGVAFFTGSEVLNRIVPVEGVVLGFLVSGAIVLVLNRVQRFAEGLADHVMHGVEDTPAYVRGRKHTVYRAALEGAIEDGAITVRERAILDRLREQLRLPAHVAQRLEHEMTAAGG